MADEGRESKSLWAEINDLRFFKGERPVAEFMALVATIIALLVIWVLLRGINSEEISNRGQSEATEITDNGSSSSSYVQ